MLVNIIDHPQNSLESPTASMPDFPRLVGRSDAHYELLEQIERFRNVDASILITGESGTGKEQVARSLHETSLRRNERFEAINCSAIPENLLESELFGHVRGAFTDAKSERKGFFEICTNGTLLLDEMGDLPLNLQVKLLRVLQEKEVRPIGSTINVPIATRILAATNHKLEDDIEQGNFRKDLYYRLSVLTIHIPPLRERVEDIPVLVQHFIEKLSDKYAKSIRKIQDSELRSLMTHSWPGNVRELFNAIERAVILSKNGRLDLETLFDRSSNSSRVTTAFSDGLRTMPINYHQAKTEFEKTYLSNLLCRTRGNVSEAARLAGKTRVEIYRFLSRNDVKPSEFRT